MWWYLGPFGGPSTGPLIGLQFQQHCSDERPAVDEVTQHPQLRALRCDAGDRGLRLVDAACGRQARTKQATRSQVVMLVLMVAFTCLGLWLLSAALNT